VADAIDVLETRMLKQDRVKPENYIYNLIIGECGRLGYTKKAFQLYNQVCLILMHLNLKLNWYDH